MEILTDITTRNSEHKRHNRTTQKTKLVIKKKSCLQFLYICILTEKINNFCDLNEISHRVCLGTGNPHHVQNVGTISTMSTGPLAQDQ
jgi:hypothetical protein